jgi:hypothetical protein
MRRIILTFFLLGLVATSSTRADGLDIFLNNDTVSVDYLTNYRGSDINFGYLYSTSGDWAGNIGLLVLGREYGADSKMEGGLGAKMFVTSVGSESIVAASIGGQVTYFPRSSRFGLGGYLYFAPDIVTFGGKGLMQYGVRAEFQMVETASAFIGLHKIEVENDASVKRSIDDGLHVGINLRF